VSRFYTPLLVLHVLVAVLALGSVASAALLAATARRAGRSATDVSPLPGPLLQYSVFGLAAMSITGILMDLAAGGAFRGGWWFRGSALLLFEAGALHGQARKALRPERVEDGGGEVILKRVERIAYGMCVLLGAITVLMEVKPFR
jgi:hypothetical protein